MIRFNRLPIFALALALGTSTFSRNVASQEVIVLGGLEQAMAWLEAEDWWGEENHEEQLTVPHAMITGFSARWRELAQQLPVPQKKEVFYRFMLPLIVHANELVLERRAELLRIRDKREEAQTISPSELEWLRDAAVLLRIIDSDAAAALPAASEQWTGVIDDALYKADVIPAGLVLGQAAYESGYGTSRFTIEGNALFGQWTYGGKGLVPEQQRQNLGDHRIAAYDWPFDSVRGYYVNLMSHPAYEDFRRLRARLRATGQPLSSMALADGLIRYSERGQEYVDTLKGIIRVNGLDIADNAVFRDEPIRFIVGAEDPAAVMGLEQEIDQLRESGELARIVARMRLE